MISQTTRFVLAYDAGCGPCKGFKAAVRFLDARGRIEFVPLQAAERSGLMDAIEPSARYSSFHLFPPASGGRREAQSGAEALMPLARALSPSRRAASFLEGAPGGARFLAFAYSSLSRLHRACPAVLEPKTSPEARPPS